jgi:Protein of unknown function (DUF4241)
MPDGASMSGWFRLIHVAIVTSIALVCGSPSTSRREAGAPAQAEAAVPSPAAARFSSEGAGRPDVGSARLEVQSAGDVRLPHGRLAVSDAFVIDSPVVVGDLPSGTYAVELLVAQAAGDARIAAARLRVRKDPVARWRRAGVIAIDSGSAAFFDPRISASITAANVEAFNDRLQRALEASYRRTYGTAAMSWQDMTVLAFSTGFGDGTYPVYLGSTAGGLPAAVLVDCEILPWSR